MKVIWTFDKIKKSAKRYKTRKDWRKDNKSSYNVAKIRKLTSNKIITGHFIKSDNARKWTPKKIIKSAKKYKHLIDWRKNHYQAYIRAHRTGLLKKIKLKMKGLGDQYSRCIYSIKVRNRKIIYIGLTFNYETRIKAHLKSNRFKELKKEFGKNSIITKKITRYISRDNAAKLEQKIIDDFKKKGFKLLNKIQAGGLGSMKRKWNKKAIYDTSKNYNYLKDWREKETGAYQAAKKLGYLDDIRKNLIKGWEFKWNKKSIFKDAKKYQTRTEWARSSRSYDAAQRKGWIDKASKHMRDGNIFWTKEKVLLEAKKFNKRIDFQNKSKGAYVAAQRIGCYHEAVKHMKKFKNQYE
jgi:hypothetical protein